MIESFRDLEVYKKASKPEFKRFISMSLGSAHETLVWLDYIEELGYVEPKMISEWKNEIDTVIKMLHGLHSKI